MISKRSLVAAGVVLLIYLIIIGTAAAFFDFNLSAFLLVGEKKIEADWDFGYFPGNTVIFKDSWGYDGSSYFLVARDPLLLKDDVVPEFKQNNFIRYQRVLYPLLAYLVSFGNPEKIAIAMIFINLASVFVGAYFLGRLLEKEDFGLYRSVLFWINAGLLFSVAFCMTEPLALMLFIVGLHCYRLRNPLGTFLFFSLALLAKESVIIFVASAAIYEIFRRRGYAVLWTSLSALPVLFYRLILGFRFGFEKLSSGLFVLGFPFRGMYAKFVDSLNDESGRGLRNLITLAFIVFVIFLFLYSIPILI